MASEKNSFILYTEYDGPISTLTLEQKGLLLTAIMNYQTKKPLPEMDGTTAMAFSFIRTQFERDDAKYADTVKKRAEAGRSGGVARANNGKQTQANMANATNAKQNKQSVANLADNEDDNEDEYVDDNESTSLRSVLRASACEDGSEEVVKEYLAFVKSHPQIIVDITNPSDIATVDYGILAKKIAESKFLQTRYSLKWLIRHYSEIIADAYKDFYINAEARSDGAESEEEIAERFRREHPWVGEE